MWTTDKMPDQSGKTIIVTGANVGIGYETALALYKTGATVILASRNLEKLDEAIKKMKLENGTGLLKAAELDLASLASIKEFANWFISNHKTLDCLINNAGVMMPPASKTEEELELQFGVNYVGHFALTGLLFPILDNTNNARVITVSSGAYRSGTINFDNLRLEQNYEPFREYAQSKLADMIFSVELQKRIERIGSKVISIAVQPGANKTDLARFMSKEDFEASLARVGELMEPWQGALPTLLAATSQEVKGGDFYEPEEDGYRGYPVKAEILELALNPEVNAKLWNFAEEVTGVQFP